MNCCFTNISPSCGQEWRLRPRNDGVSHYSEPLSGDSLLHWSWHYFVSQIEVNKMPRTAVCNFTDRHRGKVVQEMIRGGLAWIHQKNPSLRKTEGLMLPIWFAPLYRRSILISLAFRSCSTVWASTCEIDWEFPLFFHSWNLYQCRKPETSRLLMSGE